METEQLKPGLDTAALQEFIHESGFEEQDVRDLFQVFMEEAPELFAALRAAAAEGEQAALEGTAHAFKSAAAMVSARRLASLLAGLEEDARGGRGVESTAVEAVGLELDQVTEELARYG